MKTKSIDQILKDWNENTDRAVPNNRTLSVSNIDNYTLDNFRTSLFNVCARSIDYIINNCDDITDANGKLYELQTVLEFGGKLSMKKEAEFLDELNTVDKKKTNDLIGSGIWITNTETFEKTLETAKK